MTSLDVQLRERAKTSSPNHARKLRRAANSIEQALKVRSVVGALREKARQSTSKRQREALRSLAVKIEHRRQMNLSTSWWVNKAEEMVR